LTIHRNPAIEFNTIFGRIEIGSLIFGGMVKGLKPLVDEMHITHQGARETRVNAP